MWRCRQRADQVVAAAAQTHRQLQVPDDGIFLLVVHVASLVRPQTPGRPLNITVHIEMRADYGYLSAADWPNLPVRDPTCRFVTQPAGTWSNLSTGTTCRLAQPAGT